IMGTLDLRWGPAHRNKAIRSTSRTNWHPRDSVQEMWTVLRREPAPLDFSIWQHIENKVWSYHSNISDLKVLSMMSGLPWMRPTSGSSDSASGSASTSA
ncbi:Hypothetical protein FKW44_008820, partial [Caligus rogercresseyi]